MNGTRIDRHYGENPTTGFAPAVTSTAIPIRPGIDDGDPGRDYLRRTARIISHSARALRVGAVPRAHDLA